MIFRRRPTESSEPYADDADREPETATDHRGKVGPWDAAERPPDADDPRTIDLGGLVITGRVGFELRLQTDQATGAVTAVLLVARDGALELRPFAAGRSTGIWDDVRRDIAAEAARLGGTATQSQGEYGVELRVVVPAKGTDGGSTTQTSRVVGIEGPRWLLRATYLGAPATSTDPEHVLVQALRDVIVVRGQEAMAPREPLPLRLPANAQVVGDDSQ